MKLCIFAIAVTVTTLLTSAPAFSQMVSHKVLCQKADYTIEFTQPDGPQPDSCKMIVRSTKEDLSLKDAPWWAHHHADTCEPQLKSYIGQLQSQGWSCKDINQEAPAKAETGATAEAPKETPHESKKESTYKFSVEPFFDFNRIDAKDEAGEKATIVSPTADPGLKLTFAKELTHNWGLDFSVAGKYSELEINGGDDELEGHENFLWQATAATSYKLLNSFAIGLEGKYAKQLFPVVGASGHLGMESINLPEIMAFAHMYLLQTQFVNYGADLGASYLFSGSEGDIEAKEGYGYRLNLFADAHGTEVPFQVNLFFEQRIQNTEDYDSHSTSVGLSLAFVFGSEH